MERKNREIMREIQKLLGIDPDNYNDCIKWTHSTKEELLKFERAIKLTIKRAKLTKKTGESKKKRGENK